MLDDLYSGPLLEAAGAIPPEGRLPPPAVTARKVSRVCGSSLELDLLFEKGRVADIAMRVKACALGQAAACLFARAANGASAEELATLQGEMRAMLKEGGPPPRGARWAGLAPLQAIAAYPPRHASTLLVFDAAAEAAAARAAAADA